MDFASFYNEQPDYAEFRNDPERREYYSVVVNWKVNNLVRLMPAKLKPSNILEVGCAFGVLLNNMGDKLGVKNRTGIDIASTNIDVANSLYPDCTFFRGTLGEFLRENGGQKFDLVVLSDIVEHIPEDEDFMREVGTVAEYALLNLPLEKSFTTRNRQYGEQDPSGHLRSYDRKDAENLVTKAGFQIVSAFTDIAFFDKDYRRVYTARRDKRIKAKPALKRIFWSLFYFAEDRLKLMNKGLTHRIIGENYFALLKPLSSTSL